MTTLTASLGRTSRQMQVVVAEQLPRTDYQIPDLESVSINPPQPGYYVAKVWATDQTAYGISTSWKGGICSGTAEARHHEVRCLSKAPTALILTIPAVLGWGPTASGYVSLARSPVPLDPSDDPLLPQGDL